MSRKQRTLSRLAWTVRSALAVLLTVSAIALCVLLAFVFSKSSLLSGPVRIIVIGMTLGMIPTMGWLCGIYLDRG